MEQNVRRVRNKPIALRQKRMCVAEHDLKARGPLRLRPQKVGYPPGADLTNEQCAIRNPQLPNKPARVRQAIKPCAEK